MPKESAESTDAKTRQRLSLRFASDPSNLVNCNFANFKPGVLPV